MIYLLTAIGLSPDSRSAVHIYTQTIRRTIQNKQYTEQHNLNFAKVIVIKIISCSHTTEPTTTMYFNWLF